MVKDKVSPMQSLLDQNIKVKEIIEQSGLDVNEVAKHLFPGNKFPKVALDRVIDGTSLLNSEQMLKLAAMTNLTVSELYGGQWKQVSKENIIVFESNNYRAELDTKTWITKIFDNGSMFHESVIHSGATALSEYLKKLNSIISKHKP